MVNDDRIKSYDELNADEHAVLDAFRDMRIRYDKSRIELINYRINDLINSYDEILKLRNEIRSSYFSIVEYINEEEFAEIDRYRLCEVEGGIRRREI